MLGVLYTSPRKPPTKKAKYRENGKEGPRGGYKRISEKAANTPMPESKWTPKNLRDAYEQRQRERGQPAATTITPFAGVSNCCGFEDGGFEDGGFGDGGFGDDGEGMSTNGGDYDADAEDNDDDDEGLEDMSPAALASYMERVQRGVPTSNGEEQSGSGKGKRVYSTNVKRQRVRWKEFVACVTGKSAWHAVQEWGSKEATIRSKSGSLCDCTETVLLPTVSMTGIVLLSSWEDADSTIGWRMEEFKICETGCPYQKGWLGFLSKQCYPSSPKKPRFAFSTDLPDFFHLLYMGGPSSKQGFCTAVQRFLEYKVTPHPEIDYQVHSYLSDHLNARSPKTYMKPFSMSIVPGKR
jgi:hypothetical protein